MSRRRAAFDWRAAPDEGDAAAGSRDLAAWLAAAPPPRDWEAALGPVRDALARLSGAPLVEADPACRALLLGLAAASDMAEVDAAVSALARRVDEIAGARVPSPERRRIGL